MRQPAPQEIPPLPTSMLFGLVAIYTLFGSAVLAVHPVSGPGRVGLASSCLFQPLQRSPANGREPWRASQPPAVVLSLVQLGIVRRRGPRPEHREEPSGRLPWSFRFLPTLSLFHPTSSLLHPMHLIFDLTLFRVRPTPLSAGQVVVQQPNLVFWQEQTIARGRSIERIKSFFISEVNGGVGRMGEQNGRPRASQMKTARKSRLA